MHRVKLNVDVTNTATGERLHRVTWSRDGSSITVYTNFGVWAVFTGARAQMVNQMFMRVMNEIVREEEHKERREQPDAVD